MNKIFNRIKNRVVVAILSAVMITSAIIPATQVFADEYNGALPRILVNCSYALFSFHNDEWVEAIDKQNGYCEEIESAVSYFQGDFLEYGKLVNYAAYINVPGYKIGINDDHGIWTFASANTQIGLDSFLNDYMNGELNEKQLKELRKTYPFLVVMEYDDQCKLSVKRLWCAGGNEETYIADMEMYANTNNGPLNGVVPNDVQLGAPRDMYIIWGIPYNVGMYPTLDFDMTTGKNVKKYIPDYSGANKRKTPTLSGVSEESTTTSVSAEVTDVPSENKEDISNVEVAGENNAEEAIVSEAQQNEEKVDYSNSNMLLRLLIVMMALLLIAAIVIIIILLTRKGTTSSGLATKEEIVDKQDE